VAFGKWLAWKPVGGGVWRCLFLSVSRLCTRGGLVQVGAWLRVV
jgi:hypothetical protein